MIWSSVYEAMTLMRDVLQAREEDPLPYIGFEQQIFFLVGEFEGLLHEVDRGRRLAQKS